MATERICAVCVKRYGAEGGNGQCPLPPGMRLEFMRGERECRYFLLGDLKPPRQVTVASPDTLF